MRMIFALLFFASCVGYAFTCGAQEPPQPLRGMTTQELVASVQNGIVRIEMLYSVDVEETAGEGKDAKRVVVPKINTGTGFLVPGGYIVTNHHVVTVSLKPGEKLKEFLGYRGTFAFDIREPDRARPVRERPNPFVVRVEEPVSPDECMRYMVTLGLVQKDELADLAVLRPYFDSGITPKLWVSPLEGNPVNPVMNWMEQYALKFAPPTETQVGDDVVAIGFARSLAGPPTVSKGIVSALNRELIDQHSFTDLIQTDAAINPGNSGGPLIDMHGRVVGVNTYSLNHVGTPGIGFARSARTAAPFVEMLQKGPLRRPNLGIETVNPSPEENDILGLAPGLLVIDVKQNSPADKAGVQPGDLLVRVGNVPVARQGDLNNALALLGDHEATDLVVWRLPEDAIRNLAAGEAGFMVLKAIRDLRPYGAIKLDSIKKLTLIARLK